MRPNLNYKGDLPLDERSARAHAMRWLRANLGQSPYIEDLRYVDGTWEARLGAQYPKLLVDAVTGKPRRPLFYEFQNVGILKIKADSGDIVERSTSFEVRSRVQSELNEVHSSVERALTRVGARNLSMLPFGEHMHTPLKNVLSWLLFENEWTIQEEEEVEPGVLIKWRDYLAKLESVGLVTVEGNKAFPGNNLVEILGQRKSDHEKVREAMALFFASGYQDIESIRQVVGPHLTLARIIYEDSVEVGEVVPLSYASVKERMMESAYGRQKERMIPRYLVQLSEVGLVAAAAQESAHAFAPDEGLFHQVLRQDSLLQPLRARLVGRG